MPQKQFDRYKNPKYKTSISDMLNNKMFSIFEPRVADLVCLLAASDAYTIC